MQNVSENDFAHATWCAILAAVNILQHKPFIVIKVHFTVHLFNCSN